MTDEVLKPSTKLEIKYTETQELRDTSVEELLFHGAAELNAMRRAGIKTIGDILDNWNNLPIYAMRHCAGKGASFGPAKVQHIHASVFAYMCEKGAIDLKQEVKVIA